MLFKFFNTIVIFAVLLSEFSCENPTWIERKKDGDIFHGSNICNGGCRCNRDNPTRFARASNDIKCIKEYTEQGIGCQLRVNNSVEVVYVDSNDIGTTSYLVTTSNKNRLCKNATLTAFVWRREHEWIFQKNVYESISVSTNHRIGLSIGFERLWSGVLIKVVVLCNNKVSPSGHCFLVKHGGRSKDPIDMNLFTATTTQATTIISSSTLPTTTKTITTTTAATTTEISPTSSTKATETTEKIPTTKPTTTQTSIVWTLTRQEDGDQCSNDAGCNCSTPKSTYVDHQEGCHSNYDSLDCALRSNGDTLIKAIKINDDIFINHVCHEDNSQLNIHTFLSERNGWRNISDVMNNKIVFEQTQNNTVIRFIEKFDGILIKIRFICDHRSSKESDCFVAKFNGIVQIPIDLKKLFGKVATTTTTEASVPMSTIRPSADTSSGDDNTVLVAGCITGVVLLVLIVLIILLARRYKTKRRLQKNRVSTTQATQKQDDDYYGVSNSVHNPAYDQSLHISEQVPSNLFRNTQNDDSVYDQVGEVLPSAPPDKRFSHYSNIADAMPKDNTSEYDTINYEQLNNHAGKSVPATIHYQNQFVSIEYENNTTSPETNVDIDSLYAVVNKPNKLPQY